MSRRQFKLIERRKHLVNILDNIKFLLFIIGFMGFLIGSCAADTEGPGSKYVFMELIISVVLIGISILMEKFIVNYLVDDIVEYDNYIFNNTYDDDVEDDYFDWLDENDLDDNTKNYEYYLKYIA